MLDNQQSLNQCILDNQQCLTQYMLDNQQWLTQCMLDNQQWLNQCMLDNQQWLNQCMLDNQQSLTQCILDNLNAWLFWSKIINLYNFDCMLLFIMKLSNLISNTNPWIPSMWENNTKYLPMNPIHVGKLYKIPTHESHPWGKIIQIPTHESHPCGKIIQN